MCQLLVTVVPTLRRTSWLLQTRKNKVDGRTRQLALAGQKLNHKFLGAFAVRSGSVLICTRPSPWVSFLLSTRTLSTPVLGISQPVSLDRMWIHMRKVISLLTLLRERWNSEVSLGTGSVTPARATGKETISRQLKSNILAALLFTYWIRLHLADQQETKN